MARCQLVAWLCLFHLCLSSAYGGYDQYQDPRLIPSRGFNNPYAAYSDPNYPAENYMPEAPVYDRYRGYPQQQYPRYDQPEPVLIDMDASQTPEASTGGVAPVVSTGGSPSAEVQTPQETQESAATSTASSTPPANSNMDALDIQLAAALEAVKADMISKGKQVLEEKQWTDDVKAVIEQYQKKITNVYANIEKLKKDMGELYQKKGQIQNAQISKELTEKLKLSKQDLETVTVALERVQNTQAEFEQSRKDIQGTIDSIMAQLAELKGQPAPGAGSTGGASGEAAGGEEAAGDNAEGDKQESDAGSDGAADEEEASDTDIVDRKAEISSNIDTIKSIVDALNTKRRRRF